FFGRDLQSLSGAGGHTEQAVAQDAGHGIRVDVGCASAVMPRRIDLDALGGAYAHAFAAARAHVEEFFFWASAGRSEPDGLGGRWEFSPGLPAIGRRFGQ